MFALAQPSSDLVTVATKSGLTLVEQGLLGALTVVAISLAVCAVWKVLKVQDSRVADIAKYTKERDRLFNEMITLNAGMKETFATLYSSLEELKESEKQGQEVLRGVRQSLDTIVLTAVSQTTKRR
jgi:hypothetical protein